MKDKIDAIYKEITGIDASQTSTLEFHPAPEGGHMFVYLPSANVSYGTFQTEDEFRALVSLATPKKEVKVKKAAKKAVKKAVTKKVAKKAVKKVAKKK